jgi:hypothetical protein
LEVVSAAALAAGATDGGTATSSAAVSAGGRTPRRWKVSAEREVIDPHDGVAAFTAGTAEPGGADTALAAVPADDVAKSEVVCSAAFAAGPAVGAGSTRSTGSAGH